METYEGTVADEGDITSPFLGQRIYETSTGRLKYYNGTDWVIYGGGWPRASLTVPLTGTQPISSAIATEIDYTGGVLFDTDSFYSGTGGNFFIQAGLGGDYMVAAFTRYSSTVNSGPRALQITTSGNTFTDELTAIALGSVDPSGSTAAGWAYSRPMRLSEGTTIVHNAYQATGDTIDVIQAGFSIHMIRHSPGL
jgi:hypothetical protein